MLEKDENANIINEYKHLMICVLLLFNIFKQGIENSNNPFIRLLGIIKVIIE